MKSIKDLNLKDKKILLRVDLNSDVHKGRIIESDRIKAHAETIKFLLKKKARVVILAHQGSKGEKDFVSLKKHSKYLNKYVKVRFIKDIIGKKAIREIKNLKSGRALLLENVRFLKEEFKPGKNQFVKNLAPCFDYYVNDAFSISHRNQTSVVSFPKVLPSAIGLVMEKEIKNLEKLKSKLKGCLFILGGKKSRDVISLINNKNIITTGKLSFLCLIAKGHNLGKENELLKKDLPLIPKIKKNLKNIKTPVDLAISLKGKRKNLNLDSFPQKYPILDIGKETIENYKKEIRKAKAIFFKGSPGMFENKGFELGTKELLKAIADSKAFSVIAGGQSSDALNMFKIDKKKFSYISLSGGSLVKYLVGEKLVGLEALR